MKKRKVKFLRKNWHQKGCPSLKAVIGRFKLNDRVVIRSVTQQLKSAPERVYCGKVGQIKRIVGQDRYIVHVKNRRSVSKINVGYPHLIPQLC
jgi:ribosomal protein L21E